MKQVIAEC